MRTILIFLALFLVALFVATNWPAIIAPADLRIAWYTVRAPIGLVLLGVLVTVTLTFLLYLGTWQASILLESRRSAKETQALRALADEAEASRLTALGTSIQRELDLLSERLVASESALRGDIHDSGNSLAAMLAEIDDRMKLGR
ncbi:MAG: LapA family protein [Pseudomonadota bacterium]